MSAPHPLRLNHQPPAWALSPPPPVLCPPPRLIDPAAAQKRPTVTSPSDAVPRPTPPVSPPPTREAVEAAAEPVEAPEPKSAGVPSTPRAVSNPRERHGINVSLPVMVLALLAVMVITALVVPAPRVAATHPQEDRVDAFTQASDLGLLNRLGDDGPVVSSGSLTREDLAGGPVLLTPLGSLGHHQAMIFGQPDDLSGLPAVGGTFTVEQAGTTSIDFTVTAVSDHPRGAAPPDGLGPRDLLVVSCLDGCRSLQVVAATPNDPAVGLIGTTTVPGPITELPAPPAAGGWQLLTMIAAGLVLVAIMAGWLLRRVRLRVAGPVAAAAVVAAGWVAARVGEGVMSWAA